MVTKTISIGMESSSGGADGDGLWVGVLFGVRVGLIVGDGEADDEIDGDGVGSQWGGNGPS